MATRALYNRWRGQVFADILGQDHITKTLQNQIRAGRVAHAYLFAGMRGTGKTSTARIMAKAVNCVGETDAPPCDHCHICRSIAEGRSLDLIEIDGASNRGIDEVRQLRDSVNFSPSEGRYKIYVIDEVHMLTNEAFNALLKTLEEPPPHVIFILCTTAPHRLPDTVLSRCQRFDFRRAPLPLLLQKLRMICDQEKIAVKPDALEFIARRATGSFRDAESLLDQLATYSDGLEEITVGQVQTILGSVSSALVTRLLLSMTTGDLPAGLRAINEAIDTGAEPRQFLREIIDHLRSLLLVKVGGRGDRHALSAQAMAEIDKVTEGGSFSVDSLVWAIKLFNEAASGLRYAVRPQLPLELAFVEAAQQLGAAPAQTERPAALPTEQSAFEEARREEVVVQHKAEEAEGQAIGEPAHVPVEAAAPAGAPSLGGAGAPSLGGAGAPSRGGAGDESAPATVRRSLVREQEEEPHALGVAPTGDASSPVAIVGADQTTTTVAAEKTGASAEVPVQTLSLKEIRGKWHQVLAHVRPQSRPVEALLKDTQAINVRGDLITIGCEFPFHKDKLSEDKNREIIAQAASQVLGIPCRVRCVLHSPENGAASQPHRGSSPMDEPQETTDARQRLLNHPAVKELERRGGRISKVNAFGQDEQEDGGG